MQGEDLAVDVIRQAATRREAAGQIEAAMVLLDEVLRLRPDDVDACLRMARLRLGTDPAGAIALARRVVERQPQNAGAWAMLGQACSALSRGDAAVDAFTRACDLEPANALAHANLAVALVRAGAPHRAIEVADRGIALDPRSSAPHAARGHALSLLARSDNAREAFERALECDPGNVDALCGLATALKAMGRPSSAAIAFLRAGDLARGRAPQLIGLAGVYGDLGDHGAAREISLSAAARDPASMSLGSNALMSLQYDPDVDDHVATEAACDWGRRMVQMVAPAAGPPRRKPLPGERIRVGYVSADLYRHPVGWLGSGAIIAHDKQRVHVTVYANQTASDELTQEVRAAVDAWVPVLGIDDEALTARIVADQIDVLVDLSGHTSGHRLGVFARRPAPVQVSWLGYFATTGLPTMDYVLLDEHHRTAESEAFFIERIICMPGIRFCYRGPDYAPAPSPLPSATRGYVTFGSFNNSAKVNQQVLTLWARLLRAVPDSKLLLKWRSYADPVLQARTRAHMAAAGVDPARLLFDGATPHAAMLAQYGDIDIALDPFPFSGGLTSCEALWMGVPVVTMPGRRPVSRQTHAILATIGREDLSAASPDTYVATAVNLAQDPRRLADMRQRLRQEMVTSPLCSAQNIARNLEDIFRHLINLK